MKKLTLLTLILSSIIACKKDSSNSSNALSSFPISFTRYSSLNHRSVKETFNYNTNKNLVGISTFTSDTSGSEISIDSGTYSFIGMTTNGMPSGYVYNHREIIPDRGSDNYNLVENHLLYYNSQNQIIKDSGLDNRFTGYYSYFGNVVNFANYLHDGGNNSFILFYRDSLMLNVAENLSNRYEFNQNGPGWNINIIKYADNFVKNPFYNKTLSNSLGAFFITQGLGDFLSIDLNSEYFSFTWTLDSSGRIVYGDGGNGDLWLFTYK